MTGFVVESFTPMAKNTLLGFATVRVPSGLLFHDVGVHRQGGRACFKTGSHGRLG
jgi:hypothetical protein